MILLRNDALEVHLPDPRNPADAGCFGARYCQGGSVWQVRDLNLGNLLTGPLGDGLLDPMHGQGLPDDFGGGALELDGEGLALVPGVGICDRPNRRVLAPAAWRVEAGKDLLRFFTRHQEGGYDLELEREVCLRDRTVEIRTAVRNGEGSRPCSVIWYPHPFLPWVEEGRLCRLEGLSFDLPANPGYQLDAEGWICRKEGTWGEGCYLMLEHAAEAPVEVHYAHSLLPGGVRMTTDYVPSFFPIWGNRVTFSAEPHFEQSLPPGACAAWGVSYAFLP